MFKKFFKSALIASAAFGLTTAAHAETSDYTIDPNSNGDLVLLVGDNGSEVAVEGDGDTDLDFVIYDIDGNVVHNDADVTDVTYTTLDAGVYRLHIVNNGDVSNDLAVAVDNGSAMTTDEFASLD